LAWKPLSPDVKDEPESLKALGRFPCLAKNKRSRGQDALFKGNSNHSVGVVGTEHCFSISGVVHLV